MCLDGPEPFRHVAQSRDFGTDAADGDDGGLGHGPAIATGLALAALRWGRTLSIGGGLDGRSLCDPALLDRAFA